MFLVCRVCWPRARRWSHMSLPATCLSVCVRLDRGVGSVPQSLLHFPSRATRYTTSCQTARAVKSAESDPMSAMHPLWPCTGMGLTGVHAWALSMGCSCNSRRRSHTPAHHSYQAPSMLKSLRFAPEAYAEPELKRGWEGPAVAHYDHHSDTALVRD